MKNLILVLSIFLVFFFTGCSQVDEIKKDDLIDPTLQTSEMNFSTSKVSSNSNFAKGADVSWLTEMESKGWKFRKADSYIEQDVFRTLKIKGINSIRLRVFVNPANKWCNQADVIAKAKRAKDAGMRIMIDFHFSDEFADPSNQKTPVAWKNYTLNEATTAVYNHTKNVLIALRNSGIVPEWVQVGNETNDGMMWPLGRVTNKGNNWTHFKNFAWLQRSGYSAVKEVFPFAKVIVHIGDGTNNDLAVWILEGLWKNGAKWDVIGLSHYPTPENWFSMNAKCLANMNALINKYNSEIMICETGMSADKPAIAQAFLTNLIDINRNLKNNRGIGVFYWEPQCYKDWSRYYKGAFNDSGQPTIALDAFKN